MIEKTGILRNMIVEPYITLSDGSQWQLLCAHLIDHGNHLFTSTNAGYCNDYGLFSRCRYADKFLFNNKYEFYAIQDGKEMRWTQTNKPSASAIAGFTVISGPVTRGLVRHGSSTYFGYGSWWGAVGSWTPYGSGATRGIPGMDSTNAIDHLFVYGRIEKPIAFIEDNSISGGQFYEY